MIKPIKYIALGITCAAALVSCSDFLDQVPDDRVDITIKQESDETNVIMMLNAAYPNADYAWISELMSDNLIDNLCPHLPSSPNDKQILSHYNFGTSAKYDDELFRFDPANTANATDWDSPGFVWSYYWTSVATCNYIINAIDDWEVRNGKISEKLKAARAEAKLIRSYDHFILANLFCQPYRDAEASKADIGLPYITEPETQLIVKHERGNVADLYACIEKDLEDGLKDISNINMGISYKFHFNEDAAHAYAARFYLFTRQYAKVIEHANAVLGNSDAEAKKRLLNYSIFDECTSLSDFAKQWQHPNTTNNIMLNTTASILSRKVFGHRYSYAGEKCQETLMIRTNSKLWSGYICPIQSLVSFNLASSSMNDYGFTTSKIGEEFEYSDKIAGIGTPHIIQRTFTGNSLLLERAEAKIMLGQFSEGASDLMLYWNYAYESMTEKTRNDNAKYWNDLTPELINEMYSVRTEKVSKKDPITMQTTTKDTTYIPTPNSFFPEVWVEQAHSVSSTFNIPEGAYIYLNCVNDFRRWENCFEGMRFFDIKRWGIPYAHKIGLQSEIYDLPMNSPKRALEVPWETIASGLESSRGEMKPDTRSRSLRRDVSKFIYKPAK